MATQRSNSRTSIGAVALALSLVLTACGSNSSLSMNARSAADSVASSTTVETAGKHPLHRDITVSIRNYSYHPTTLTVTIGAKVTFTNRDQTSHTATSTKTAFDTGTVTPGHSAAVVFTKPSIYTYYCQFHAFMRGTIIVK